MACSSSLTGDTVLPSWRALTEWTRRRGCHTITGPSTDCSAAVLCVSRQSHPDGLRNQLVQKSQLSPRLWRGLWTCSDSMIRKLCSSEASPTALRVGSRGGLLSQPVAAPITPLLRGADAPHPRNPRRITLAHHGDAVGLVAQRAETGDVVG